MGHYARSHLLGRAIRRELVRQKALDSETSGRLAWDADSPALDREPAFYGSPEGAPAGDLFERGDAEEALEKAGRVLAIVREAFARYRQGG